MPYFRAGVESVQWVPTHCFLCAGSHCQTPNSRLSKTPQFARAGPSQALKCTALRPQRRRSCVGRSGAGLEIYVGHLLVGSISRKASSVPHSRHATRYHRNRSTDHFRALPAGYFSEGRAGNPMGGWVKPIFKPPAYPPHTCIATRGRVRSVPEAHITRLYCKNPATGHSEECLQR